MYLPSFDSPALRLASVAGVLAMVGAPAHALELWGTGTLASSTLTVLNDVEVRYWQVPDRLEGFEDRAVLNYVEQVSRTNLLLSKPGLSVGLQVDQVALFANRYYLDDELFHERVLYDPNQIISPWDDALVVSEKMFLTKSWDGVEVTVGDVYGSFGRGIALNIVKNTDIDVDTSLRGARVKMSSGDIDLTALSGLTNVQQISQDNPNQGIERGVADMITGAQLAHYGLGPFQATAHGAMFTFGRQEDLGQEAIGRYGQELDAASGGVGLTLLGAAGVDWYLEGDLIRYFSAELADGDEDGLLGHAIYGSAAAYPGKTTVLVEAKHTADTERLNLFTSGENYEVSSVPTLEYERVITEDGSAAVNSNDVSGARVRVDYAANPGVFVPYLAVTGLRDRDLGGLHFNQSPETVVHPVAGLQWFEGERVVQLNTGFRQDQRDDAAEGADRLAHLDGELHVPVGHGDAIELAVGVKSFWWGNNLAQQADFLEMENALVWHRGDQWQFVLYQDWSNNPLVNSEGNLGEQLYGALEIKYEPRSTTEMRLFYGAYKAGIRCSGGQCRQLPGFEGARFAWTNRF